LQTTQIHWTVSLESAILPYATRACVHTKILIYRSTQRSNARPVLKQRLDGDCMRPRETSINFSKTPFPSYPTPSEPKTWISRGLVSHIKMISCRDCQGRPGCVLKLSITRGSLKDGHSCLGWTDAWTGASHLICPVYTMNQPPPSAYWSNFY